MARASIRQLIIDDVVTTLKTSGLVQGVTDDIPDTPADYAKPEPSHAWVFESGETSDYENLVSKNEPTLNLIVAITYRFQPAHLHRTGRALLAELQSTMMADHARGGHAWLTLEADNAMGLVPESSQPLGLLTTEWAIRYRRNWKDPFAK